MFHCNGWTFTWGIAARGGTNVCIRSTSAEVMYKAIADHGVTHMCCAPVVFNILFDSREAEDHKKTTNFSVEVLTGGAPPPASLLEKVKKMGFHVTHAYGMTEATGAALVCEWRAEWNQLPAEQRVRLKARQGISVLSLSEVDVKETSGLTMKSVPRDGKAVGEIVLRGSSVMKGYFKNEKATAEAFRDGWFLTGDVGVVHPDGYLEIKDRIKDIIISGGENICSMEVEKVLHSYYKVLEAAVVAMPHACWGETPCAFVVVKGEVENVTEDEILAYCGSNMPRFMVPRKVVFLEELPKNSTGKIEKKKLREMAREFKTGMVKSERSSLHGAKIKKTEKKTTAHSEQSVEQVPGMSRL
ncbi:Butyrate--CoA ligase AAE11, peroxisomal [Dendrobium catenatum]|uniref:Butyrate--CoA ligase AAE11, peroxisomal n=1 Tax=Dendrobium catenatum TaxID=906689 RepID=A0A2I0VFP9_9ASPA|nr:Butyrate--CoA ligase AAE11, peroxisomal [Dendrobium catenatum]